MMRRARRAFSALDLIRSPTRATDHAAGAGCPAYCGHAESQSLLRMAHRDAALKRMAAGPTPPGREHALREVLDRLGPSAFAGLLDPAGVRRHANRAVLQAIGGTPSRVLGRRFDAMPWWQGCERSQRRLQQALNNAVSGEGLAPRCAPRRCLSRYQRGGMQAAWPEARVAVAAADARHRHPDQRDPLAAALARDTRRRLHAICGRSSPSR